MKMSLAGSYEFQCHLIVLGVYSGFFHELNQTLLVVDLPPEKVTPNAFHFIYDWMLTTKAKVHRKGFMEIFVAANYLKINELVEQCWACMDNKLQFKEDSAFVLYLEAKQMNDLVVPTVMICRISRFFLTLVATKEFVELKADEVISLLSMNTIAVHSESEVLYSAMRWLFYDWSAREKDMISVIKCIRFGLIPPWQLVELKRGPRNHDIQRIMEVEEIYKMVEDGLHYIVSKTNKCLSSEMERLNLSEPTDRMWIDEYPKEGDEKCINYWLTNYDTFLEYLQMLRAKGVCYWRHFKYVGASVDMKCSDPRFNLAVNNAMSETS